MSSSIASRKAMREFPKLLPVDGKPQLRKLLPSFTMKEFGPGHHFLAEENPRHLCRMLVDWMEEIGA
jgi:hypothetical protein